jgi:hypothetical protein
MSLLIHSLLICATTVTESNPTGALQDWLGKENIDFQLALNVDPLGYCFCGVASLSLLERAGPYNSVLRGNSRILRLLTWRSQVPSARASVDNRLPGNARLW